MTEAENKQIEEQLVKESAVRGNKLYSVVVYHEAEELSNEYCEAKDLESARRRTAQTAWGYGWAGSPIVAIVTPV